MISTSCHCGAVRIGITRKPRTLTNCNCSICRRYGTLWAYYKASEVEVTGNTDAYSWGDRQLRFVRCVVCGCISHWERISPAPGARVGVNARNFEPSSIGLPRIRLLDGAATWKYLA